MSRVVLACCLISTALTSIIGLQITDEEYSQMPKLFHLDNYKRCLSRRGGLYCLGTFHLTAATRNPIYNLMKEHSSDPRNFNHTLLHRGYCVSSRCPSIEINSTLRFERCVKARAQHLALEATLQSLRYCRTHHQARASTETNSWPYCLFLGIIVLILLLNAVGTTYDLIFVDNCKNRLLISWSLRTNWRRLITPHVDGNTKLSSLSPIQGARVLLLMLVVMSHCIEMYYKVFLVNPNFLENAQRSALSMILRNGSVIVQTFIVISNFLLAHILLQRSRKQTLSISMLPGCILHRVIRISPVYLMAVGLTATWWRLAGDGPLWYLVLEESDRCRRKFWSHAFFAQNLVEPEIQCMAQTWFLAVDMQLYVISCLLTLALARSRLRALHYIGGLFMASCLLNATLGYVYDWTPILYHVSPENLRTTFAGVSSFTNFYISPWGSLPACLLGLFAAHLKFYAKEQGYSISKSQWLVQLYNLTIPLGLGWMFSGYIMTGLTARRLSSAVYIGIERPIFAAISALYLYGAANNLDNWFRRMMSWRGWHVPSRLSLAVLVLHRGINMQLVAMRHAPIHVSLTTVAVDMLVTMLCSYTVSLPATLLLEIPVRRTFVAFFS